MTPPGPLAGTGVVLTRPRAQSLALARPLEAAGARVIHCPSLEIVAVEPGYAVCRSIIRSYCSV